MDDSYCLTSIENFTLKRQHFPFNLAQTYQHISSFSCRLLYTYLFKHKRIINNVSVLHKCAVIFRVELNVYNITERLAEYRRRRKEHICIRTVKKHGS